ncbi:oligopeptide ABC transporter, periplasmic oligopeptide-binding protein OppA [Geomicrobium sp. JCM 19037]|uniref:glutathione ABC transporter substrate-binding protein n=1 Tax=Geomicrobium sp. JCM 19037 TaxID=1460634 RepID=UPI00045F43F4|nr:glutathione ABC transporter substrate-binding protein [Geomicrobium sp. JCM 19037]GAK04531.1 oligopeptide ABC transporter, periplasmic oligopeptide-binding protein OppA [Geomicrobium sp. JCM 19037]
MKKFKKSSAFGLTVAAAFALAACSTDPEEAPEDTEGGDISEDTEVSEDDDVSDDGAAGDGGELVIALSADGVSLDPHGQNDNPSAKYRSLIYETLMTFDPETYELVPGLAEEYEQIDETTFEFTLHEGVEFHNGEELTADDVVATFDRMLDPDIAAPSVFLFEMIDSVEAIDEYTVQMTTEFPFAPLLSHLAHNAGGIISETAIEQDYAGEINLDVGEGEAGTGQFVFDEWNEGSNLRMLNNENYWGEPANIDSVYFEVIGEDSTRMGSLSNGEVHVADLIQPALADQVDAFDNASLVSVPSLSLTYVGINTEVEPFDDVRVRQAISLAIDNDALVEGIYEGYGEPAKGPINDLVFGYDPDIDDIGYDPERAQELLEEAGLEDGFEFTLLMNSDNPVREQTAVLIQDQLSEIGVTASLENVEWGAYLDQTGEGDSEMFVLGWVTVTGDADYGMYSLFHSSQHGNAGNRSFYTNEEVDDLLDQARQATDDDERLELYSQVQEILVEEAPMLYTAFDELRIGVADSVENFYQVPNGQFDLSEVTITEGADVGY